MQKGQIAFESLLILLAVITSATIILALYMQYNDETIALGYARIETLEQISMLDNGVIIEKIYLNKTAAGPVITIALDRYIELDTGKIEDKIKANTSLRNIKVEVTALRQ